MVLLFDAQQPDPVRSWGYFAFQAPGSQSFIARPIAWDVHAGKTDRRDRPRIQHSIGMARFGLVDWYRDGPACEQLMALGLTADDVVAISLLHDVLEDSDDPVIVMARMQSGGISARNIQGVVDLSYFPSSAHLTPGDKVREQALQIAASPVARLLKPYDLAHNLSPSRLYPYLSAQDTVHAVWKYINLCEIAGIQPFGMRDGFSGLPAIVKAIPIVQQMLDGDHRLDNPPRLDMAVQASLKGLETRDWYDGGPALERASLHL